LLGGWTLVHLPIHYFCYLLVFGSPESSRGYGNWPVRPNGRGDEGESNRPATNFSDIAFDPNELCRLVEERGLRNS